jgi:Uma2 family endonuclease
MVAEKSPRKTKRPIKKVPEHLICEILDGMPIYYKGYLDVIEGKKTFEEIMGSSSLQAFIIGFLLKTLYKNLDETQFILFTNEAGLHLDRHNNLAGDILIYDRKELSINDINENYFSIPPKVVIEVDISVDTTNLTSEGYVHTKTRKLLDFGVEKVIWITTPGKTVMVATPKEDWQIKDWNKDVEVLGGVQFNIGQFLKAEGSKFA